VSGVGAWIRYGTPLTDEQVDFAIEHYRVALLQPWETDALHRLKDARPDMTVLCYKCLSSTRDYEPGPVVTSGVAHDEAEEAGERWFAHRLDGSRIAWGTYPGHWQMAVWDPEYRQRWVDNVGDEFEGSRWDGVLADNDVYDDYYGIDPPIEGGRGMPEIRAALDELVAAAGERLNGMGKLLVPNIAESRREPGRWARHARWGGGYEEVWLAHGPDDHFDPEAALTQTDEVAGPGLTILRVATDGDDRHPNMTYGLAAFWVFGGGNGGAYTATGHDDYSRTPWVPQLDWDLGRPAEPVRRRGNGFSRELSHGWAAVNLNAGRRRVMTFDVPAGLLTETGAPAPATVSLPPHTGIVFHREGAR